MPRNPCPCGTCHSKCHTCVQWYLPHASCWCALGFLCNFFNHVLLYFPPHKPSSDHADHPLHIKHPTNTFLINHYPLTLQCQIDIVHLLPRWTTFLLSSSFFAKNSISLQAILVHLFKVLHILLCRNHGHRKKRYCSKRSQFYIFSVRSITTAMSYSVMSSSETNSMIVLSHALVDVFKPRGVVVLKVKFVAFDGKCDIRWFYMRDTQNRVL